MSATVVFACFYPVPRRNIAFSTKKLKKLERMGFEKVKILDLEKI